MDCGRCVYNIYVGTNFVSGNDNIATLLMWIVYLGNAVIMCVRWEREVRRNRLDEVHVFEDGTATE